MGRDEQPDNAEVIGADRSSARDVARLAGVSTATVSRALNLPRAVDPATLPDNARVTHVSLFDGSLQGFALTDRPAFCFQGHPEASPGPHDVDYLFDRFLTSMEHTPRA